MTLSFKVFGFELARVDLDFSAEDPSPSLPDVVSAPLTKGVKGLSKWWVGRMMHPK